MRLSLRQVAVLPLAALILACGQAGGFSNQDAKRTLEDIWNVPDLGLVLGEVQFVKESPDASKHRDLLSELPLYRAAASAGLIAISNEKDLAATHGGWNAINPFNSEWPWRSAVVVATERGKAEGSVKKAGQIDELWVKISTYKIQEVVANDTVRVAAELYRVVQGTSSVTVVPEFRAALAESRTLGLERRFKALLHFDPFTKHWIELALDLAEKTANFQTSSVDNTLAAIRLCGQTHC